ncbi:MAG: sensor histidine kinase [Christensenellales bacterium]|jgi:two-component system sensor histidine kinase KdpD
MTKQTAQAKGNIVKHTLISVAFLAAAVLLSELLYMLPIVDGQHLVLVYILALSAIARLTSGYIYSISSAVAAAVLYEALFTGPRWAFNVNLEFFTTLLTMLVISFTASAAMVKMKRQALAAQEKERRADQLYKINNELLAAGDMHSIIRIAVTHLAAQTQMPVVFYTSDPLEEGSGILSQPSELLGSDQQRRYAHTLYRVPKQVAKWADIQGPVYYINVLSKGKCLGLVGVGCGETIIDENNMAFIRMIIGQVAMAMEMQIISDEQKNVQLEAEKEKTRSTLLRAVSHDLRTPLTGIYSASSVIFEQYNSVSAEQTKQMALDIMENAQWLIRIIENLLLVTRITDGRISIKKTKEVVEEVMAQAVRIIRKRYSNCHISIKALENPLMIPMDAILISQVLINLLDNAVKNSPAGSLVSIELTMQQGYACITVSDQGRGIPPNELDNLFEVRLRDDNQTIDAKRGIGIGLSICKTIVEAHNGEISGTNKSQGGAVFTVMLPQEL